MTKLFTITTLLAITSCVLAELTPEDVQRDIAAMTTASLSSNVWGLVCPECGKANHAPKGELADVIVIGVLSQECHRGRLDQPGLDSVHA